MTKQTASLEAEVGGKTWQWQSGKLALQADGAVSVSVGDTVVLATVVLGKEPREGVDYLPLLVDYEEKLYAAGKIKGSRWVKREGRPSDEAILTGRVIDRSLRPMFDQRIRNDIQVVATVLSADQANDPDIIALNAASAAVSISGIPWEGPVAGVRVGKVDGQLVLNPSFEQVENGSQLDLIVAATKEHIVMVEAGAREVPEAEVLQAIKLAYEEIKKIIQTLEGLKKQAGRPEKEVSLLEVDEEISSKVQALEAELKQALFESKDKEGREAAVSQLREQLVEVVDDEQVKAQINYSFDSLVKHLIQDRIVREERRVDGRKLNEVRPIHSEVGLLPRVHGSGLFQRGETQVLTTVTLGGPGDVQLLEDIDTEEERKKRYIHHYNFPGFSVGEVAPMRSPGRREIGHGALAERALMPVIPKKEDFSYTLRLVSEVLSSNGSTSMASTCGSTLALMDAGVPIKAPISGIAMGLVKDKVLSDIQGLEDGNGHMDFKVAGSKVGITALQLDVKVKGLTLEILRQALEQARAGRLFILDKMLAVLAKPREKMSPYAPRIVSIQIDPAKIRDVIGPGGKTINQIIDETGVEIDIEDDGMIMITSTNEQASQKALEWIKNLTREVRPGEQFEGVVKRIMDFGAFVEILPGQEGMIHVSELAPYRVAKVTDEVKLGDMVKVVVKEIDEMGRINLSRKALMKSDNSSKNRFRTRQTGRHNF